MRDFVDKSDDQKFARANRVVVLTFVGPMMRNRDAIKLGLAIGILPAVAIPSLLAITGGAAVGLYTFSLCVFWGLTVLASSLWLRRSSTRFESTQLSRVHAPLEGSALTEAFAAARGIQVAVRARAIARRLVSLNQHGTVIRVASMTADPIGPIVDYPFEPRWIDDCGEEPDATQEAPSRSRRSASPATTRVRALGGLFPIVSILLVWTVFGVGALARGRLTVEFLMMTAAILFLCIVPIRSNGLFGAQWFCVPGGLVRRKALPWRTRWDVHVFDRRKSVLILFHYFQHRWCAVVADEHSAELVMGTEGQIAFVLRAWLSDIEPPSIERLLGQW